MSLLSDSGYARDCSTRGDSRCYNGLMNTHHTPPALTDLHYRVTGQGPDVLLIHGFASSSRMWDRLTAAMPDARCWAVDLCGFGETLFSPDIHLSLDDHVRSLIGFCHVQGIRPRVVMGHSMGGMLALKLALVRPDLAERLVLSCPVVTGRMTLLRAEQMLVTRFARAFLRRTRRVWNLFQSNVFAPLVLAPRYVDADCQARIREDVRRARWGVSISALQAIARENLAPVLPTIHQPTLVVIGGRDYTVPPSEGRLAAARMPNAQLVEFARSHHQPLDEETQRFIALARPFVLEPSMSRVDRVPDHGIINVQDSAV